MDSEGYRGDMVEQWGEYDQNMLFIHENVIMESTMHN